MPACSSPAQQLSLKLGKQSVGQKSYLHKFPISVAAMVVGRGYLAVVVLADGFWPNGRWLSRFGLFVLPAV